MSLGNAHWDASGQFEYTTTGTASRYYQAGDQHIWYNAGSGAAGTAVSFSERMRIDSSGNLLVGTTSTGPAISSTETGIALGAIGYVAASRTSEASGFFNRLGTDGSIVNFNKSGTTVGSIGSKNGVVLIGSGATGLMFESGGNDIIPRNTDGSNSNGSTDLGSGTSRFKDLYLSGGVYLGGTGAANKLDDYEEGTWTVAADFSATSPSSGATTGAGAYTKVGNIVTVWGQCSNINVTGAVGNINITGLPFTSKANASLALYTGTVRMSRVNIANSYCVVEVRDGDSFIRIMEMIDDTNATELTTADFTDGASDIFFTLSYQAS
jgi:hypothetical protein